jgi:hypothetical protein
MGRVCLFMNGLERGRLGFDEGSPALELGALVQLTP